MACAWRSANEQKMTSKSANERSASKGSLDKGSAERRGPVLSIQKMAIFPTTLPETNSSHLKIDGWKTILSFWEFGLFSGAKWLLVSGRVVMTCSQKGRLLGGRLSHVKPHQKN